MLAKFEKSVFVATRMATLVAVIASWLGAVLMFLLGIGYTVEGFTIMLFSEGYPAAELPKGEAVVVHLIEALDRFLIAVVLLYFGYGIYGLFVRPNSRPGDLGLPDWLHVDSIGELKQTVAEVIIVILFVLFLRVALEVFHEDAADITLAGVARILLLPVSILMLAGSLRLAELHPKRSNGARRRHGGEPE